MGVISIPGMINSSGGWDESKYLETTYMQMIILYIYVVSVCVCPTHGLNGNGFEVFFFLVREDMFFFPGNRKIP